MSETKNKILNAINTYTPLLRENFKRTFVTLQGGKSLSTNDYTNADKNKLSSIESGAQVNKIENISVTGADFDFNTETKTANITISSSDATVEPFKINNTTVKGASIEGAEISFASDTAIISITGGAAEPFVLNGETIKSASITGAEISFDNDIAKISIIGGEAENFTVNGAEVTAMSVSGAASVSIQGSTAQVSITGGGEKVTINSAESNAISISGAAQVSLDSNNVTQVIIADRTPKQSANFVVTPAAITLNAFQPATISTSHDGDGIVTYYADNQFVTAEQLSATDFRVAAKYVSEGNVGFWLNETESLYGAAKNVHVVVKESTMPVLMHFDDSTDALKNEGYASFTNDGVPALIDGGKFGKAVYLGGSYNWTFSDLVLGGKDFTVDFWNKTQLNLFKIVYGGGNQRMLLDANNYYRISIDPIQSTSVTTTKPITTEWQHLALVYQHEEGVAKFYVGGELAASFEGTFERQNITDIILNNMYCDELRILDGVAAWTEEFVPPTEPY